MRRTTFPTSCAAGEHEITKGPKALIIASIDGTTLSDALQKAADAGVVVVAYDRLIKKTPNVDYYTTFDNFGVGVIQANSLVKGLKERFPDTEARGTSNCSAVRRTTTTPSSSTTAPCPCCSR